MGLAGTVAVFDEPVQRGDPAAVPDAHRPRLDGCWQVSDAAWRMRDRFLRFEAEADYAAPKAPCSAIVPAIQQRCSGVRKQYLTRLAETAHGDASQRITGRRWNQTQSCLADQTGNAETGEAGGEALGVVVAVKLQPTAGGIEQFDRLDVGVEGAVTGWILAMHIGTDATSHTCARMPGRDRKQPALAERKAHHVPDACASLDRQQAAFGIKIKQAVERRKILHHAVTGKARADVGNPAPTGDALDIGRQRLDQPIAIGLLHMTMRRLTAVEAAQIGFSEGKTPTYAHPSPLLSTAISASNNRSSSLCASRAFCMMAASSS